MLIDFLFAFFLTILLILTIIENAKRFNLIDIPNSRSSHTIPKPRGAGIAMFLSLVLTFSIFKYDFFVENILFFIGVFIVFLAGVIDDIKDVSPKLKFLFIITAIVLLYFTTDLKINSLGIWFGKDVILPSVISLIFTIFVVTGYTNALNLIDGLDGLAAGISLIIFSSFLYLGIEYHDKFIINISFIMCAVLIAFLLFNWYPSKIFMGDSGSLFLGFMISLIAIKLIEHINTISILFLASLPIVDTIIVLVRRSQRKLSPFKADKSHIHHKILRWKSKVDYSVMLLLFIQMAFSLLGILLATKSNFVDLVIYIIILKIFFYVFDDRRVPRGDLLVSFHIKIRDFIVGLKSKYVVLLFIVLLLIATRWYINYHY